MSRRDGELAHHIRRLGNHELNELLLQLPKTMASPLRRVLRWLGLTQPYSRVGRGAPFFGTPFRPSYVCPTCGALVATSAHERHIDWHVKIGG